MCPFYGSKIIINDVINQYKTKIKPDTQGIFYQTTILSAIAKWSSPALLEVVKQNDTLQLSYFF